MLIVFTAIDLKRYNINKLNLEPIPISTIVFFSFTCVLIHRSSRNNKSPEFSWLNDKDLKLQVQAKSGQVYFIVSYGFMSTRRSALVKMIYNYFDPNICLFVFTKLNPFALSSAPMKYR